MTAIKRFFFYFKICDAKSNEKKKVKSRKVIEPKKNLFQTHIHKFHIIPPEKEINEGSFVVTF